jgi:hypothetical protein
VIHRSARRPGFINSGKRRSTQSAGIAMQPYVPRYIVMPTAFPRRSTSGPAAFAERQGYVVFEQRREMRHFGTIG